MHVASRIEVAYLPEIKDSLDDVDLQVLNEGYAFASKHKFRSFCTYLDFIPQIESENYITRLVPVIDFPRGESCPEAKVFEAGRAYDICKVASAAEIDVVLHPNTRDAIDDIFAFDLADVNDKIGIKYIIELGNRTVAGIKDILNAIKAENCKCKYIKTNTGKKLAIPFKEKLELVKWLRSQTNIPIKISGGVENVEQINEYTKVAGPKTIFGVSYQKLKEWKEFNA